MAETQKKNPASYVLLLFRNQNDLEKSEVNHSAEAEHRQSFVKSAHSRGLFTQIYWSTDIV